MERSSEAVKAIAYLYPSRFHFVAKDIEALRHHLDVREHRFTTGGAWLLPWDLLRQLIFLIACKFGGVKVVLAHFAGYHTVLPVLLGFRTHIIVAGSDACSFPGMDYGSFRKPLMRRAMSVSMRRARTILPVHASLEGFKNSFSSFGPTDQGYGTFLPGLRTPSLAIPYGFDMDRWVPIAGERDPKTVLCVATGAAPDNAVHFRKGVDLLIEAAQQLPDHRFTVVGTLDPSAYQGLPDNIRMLGSCTPDQLRDELAHHSIYAQPSVMEGFPNALCEAMRMGCLPVVSNITSMPEIVGPTGMVINERTSAALIAAIRATSSLPLSEQLIRRQAASSRITPFTMERRIGALLKAIQAEETE